MAIKRTWKAVLAARILAQIETTSISAILKKYDLENLYLEMASRRFVWSSGLKTWQAREPFAGCETDKLNTPLKVQVRVMGADEVETTVSADAIHAALEAAGFDIATHSPARSNHSGNGARVYLEVLL
jgi:hypothetical protein